MGGGEKRGHTVSCMHTVCLLFPVRIVFCGEGTTSSALSSFLHLLCYSQNLTEWPRTCEGHSCMGTGEVRVVLDDVGIGSNVVCCWMMAWGCVVIPIHCLLPSVHGERVSRLLSSGQVTGMLRLCLCCDRRACACSCCYALDAAAGGAQDWSTVGPDVAGTAWNERWTSLSAEERHL